MVIWLIPADCTKYTESFNVPLVSNKYYHLLMQYCLWKNLKIRWNCQTAAHKRINMGLKKEDSPLLPLWGPLLDLQHHCSNRVSLTCLSSCHSVFLSLQYWQSAVVCIILLSSHLFLLQIIYICVESVNWFIFNNSFFFNCYFCFAVHFQEVYYHANCVMNFKWIWSR